MTNSKTWPLYQMGCDGHCVTKVRIEFVPVDLGPQGLEELHAALFALMDQGWAFVVEHGRITRLDVAVGFPKVTMDQFHFLPQQGATVTQWKQDGGLRA